MRQSAIPSRQRSSGSSGDALLASLLALTALGLGVAGTQLGLLGVSGWGLLGTLVVGALLNAGVILGGLALRRRVLRPEALREQGLRELRYLGAWASTEGVLRKAGLIQDLSALHVDGLPLAQMVLGGADLRGCRLTGADLRGADLKGANLQGAVLDGADLTDANLTDANLAMASLKGAMLRGCVCEGANLAKAEIDGAAFVRANLVNANVHGVDFRRARLERTRFALREASDFTAQVHPSVDDWIRERLDSRGFYEKEADPDATPEAGTEPPAPLRLPKAGR